MYFLICKKSRFDFADVYHLNVTFLKKEPFMSYNRFNKGGRVAKSPFLEKNVCKNRLILI